jgi:hypothetical protein
MASTYKVLAQVNPSATTATTAYTCGSASGAVVSTIAICNQAASAGTYRVAIRPAGATLATVHYVAYDVAIAANDTTALTLGITLANTDVVTVYCSAATMSISLFGTELS